MAEGYLWQFALIVITEGKTSSISPVFCNFSLAKIMSFIRHSQLGYSFLAVKKEWEEFLEKGECVDHDLLRTITVHHVMLNALSY